MLKERVYPLQREDWACYLVRPDQHPTWRVYGGDFYQNAPIRTGFIAHGRDIPLLEMCTLNFSQLDKTYELDANIVVSAVLVEVTIAGTKYMGTIDINKDIKYVTPYTRGGFHYDMAPGYTVNFTQGDPKLDGFFLREVPIELQFDRTKNELTFLPTSIGCVNVVGVQLDLHVISNQH